MKKKINKEKEYYIKLKIYSIYIYIYIFLLNDQAKCIIAFGMKSDEKIKIKTLIVSNLTNSKLSRFKFHKFYHDFNCIIYFTNQEPLEIPSLTNSSTSANIDMFSCLMHLCCVQKKSFWKIKKRKKKRAIEKQK